MNRSAQPTHYDVIIIGAGVGGLSAAAILSKCGLKVAVLEKEPRAGGYLAGFQRKGFRFDTAIHWLNQCSPDGFVSKVFDLIGEDHPVCNSLKRIQRYKSESVDFLLTDNPDEFKEALIKQYPEDRKGILKFFSHSKRIGRSFNNFKTVLRSTETMNAFEKALHYSKLLQFALPFIPYVSYTGAKMKKGLNRFFSNEKMHTLFSAETDLLSCMVPVGWAYYKDYQTPPAGGGQVIPEWLLHVVRSHENAIYLNTTVTNIRVEGDTAKGVTAISKGKELLLNSDFVIAACDLELVYTKLLPQGLIDTKTTTQLENAEIYASSFTVSIALDCPTEALGFGEEMVHLFKENIDKEAHNGGDPDLSALTILAPSVKDKTLAPEGSGTLVIFMPAYMHQFNYWETQTDRHRGAIYNELKSEIAEKLIDRVAAHIAPGLRSHILFYDVATPVTHWRYTGNKNGSMMGTKPNKANMKSNVAAYKTPVKNLLIGGHWAELGGGVPIAVKAGTNAALIILKKNRKNAFQKIIQYLQGKISIQELNSSNSFRTYDNNWIRKGRKD